LYPTNDPENRVRYRGDVCQGLPWGNGSMTWSYGATYTGSWIAGKRHGVGNYTLTSGNPFLDRDDGVQEEGSQDDQDYVAPEVSYRLVDEVEVFRLSKVIEDDGEGRGVDDDVYRGTWEQDQMHGYGVYKW